MTKYTVGDEVEVKHMERGPDLVPMETWRHGVVSSDEGVGVNVEFDNGDTTVVNDPKEVRKVTKAKITKTEEPAAAATKTTTTAKK